MKVVNNFNKIVKAKIQKKKFFKFLQNKLTSYVLSKKLALYNFFLVVTRKTALSTPLLNSDIYRFAF